ncbi:MAG: endonuclease/exonuclease/phosphatase family protein [Bacteroidota bacterium]
MLKAKKSIFRFATLFKILTSICLLCLILAYFSPFVHPTTLWIIPFFGLAYPIIILCTLILLLIWGIAKSKWFFIVLFFIIIGGNLHFRMYSLPFGKETEKSEKSLKLLSYNVKNFDVYNAGFNQDYTNRNAIFAYLKKEQADIVCFQEFYSQDDKRKFPTKDTLHRLLKANYFHDRMSFNRHFKNYFGVAMYSKYPMLTRGHIDFDDSIKNSNNFCIFADIVKGQDTFRVYNTHFQSIKFQNDDYALFGDSVITGSSKSDVKNMLKKLHIAYQKRAHQAQKVLEHMEESPYEVIICGDFNDTPMSYTYNLFYSKYIDAFRNSSSGLGVTYAGRVPAGRIDYIFHSKNIKTSNFQIQKEVFSDHKAISCEFWKN